MDSVHDNRDVLFSIHSANELEHWVVFMCTN